MARDSNNHNHNRELDSHFLTTLEPMKTKPDSLIDLHNRKHYFNLINRDTPKNINKLSPKSINKITNTFNKDTP